MSTCSSGVSNTTAVVGGAGGGGGGGRLSRGMAAFCHGSSVADVDGLVVVDRFMLP